MTTGEWAWALREVFGEFRAPTGVSSAPVAVTAEEGTPLAVVREKVARTADELGVGKLRLLVGKPGLDGHSNGAEQIAVRARDAGFEVVYQGIRLTPEQIVDAAARRGRALPQRAAPPTPTSWRRPWSAPAPGHHRRVGRALREVFGEFRAPTGVSSAPVAVTAEEGSTLADVRAQRGATAAELGVGKLRLLVGKPGLDGTATAPSRSPYGPATPASR